MTAHVTLDDVLMVSGSLALIIWLSYVSTLSWFMYVQPGIDRRRRERRRLQGRETTERVCDHWLEGCDGNCESVHGDSVRKAR